MKEITIKTSIENRKLVEDLTSWTDLGNQNHIARIALAYSLNKNYKLDLAKDLSPSTDGKEYKERTFFGNDEDKRYYIALICQKYQISKDHNDIGQYIKMHVDNGLELMQKIRKNESIDGLDFLLKIIEEGIDDIKYADSLDFVKNTNYPTLKTKTGYSKAIKILIGKHNEKEIYFTPNNTLLYPNCHIAIAGQSGVGKSYFSRKILERIVMQSIGQINFLYLDYKGLTQNDKDSSDYKSFFGNTNTTLIHSPQKPFPINPLSFIDTINEENKKVGIRRFTDIIEAFVPKFGPNQKRRLKDATTDAFEKYKDTCPRLQDILDNVREMEDYKDDSLSEILEGLTDINLFDNKASGDFINSNYYFSLAPDLSKNIRFIATFLIIYYLYTIFMNMDDAPNEGNYKQLRYVLLIDEAHEVFREKKSHEILEKLLRQTRSKGVSIMLVSQGIKEFNQKDFDFSQLCRTAFLMSIKSPDIKSISEFLGLKDNQKNKIARSMENIKTKQAISNIEEFDIGEIFNTK